MVDSDTTKEVTQAATKRPRALWQWVLGIGLLGCAGVLTAMRYMPRTQEHKTLNVEPKPIRIAADFETRDALPAKRGDFENCNLLIVTFDTTRADRIGCYGNAEIKTPNIDRLAHEGVIFSRVTAPAPITLPSHATIMTGLYPVHHGARANSRFRLADRNETLAEVLESNGFRTAAAVSSFILDSRFGIDQGFDEYDDKMEGLPDKGALAVPDRPADETNEIALEWLRKHAGDRFFLWTHFYDPHHPWHPPEPFASEYKLPYDAEIAFADSQLGELLDLLDELGLTENTLVVFAGDHGEGLGQHDEVTHAFLIYESTIQVPLIIRCGSRLGGRTHIARPVGLVDIMPTVLSLLGIDAPVKMDGVDLTQPPKADGRPLFMESTQALADHGWSSLLGVMEGTTKYIYGPIEELYDLSKDPFEQDDLAARQPDRVAAMKAHLVEFYGDDLTAAGMVQPTEELTAEELAKLRSLGYAGGTGEIPDLVDRPHPKTMMKLLARAYQSRGIEREQGADAAIAYLEELVQEHPDFTVGLERLGVLYARNDKPDQAEEAFAQSLNARPDRVQPVFLLAGLNKNRGKTSEAIELYRQVARRSPQDFGALRALAEMLLERGEYGEAAEYLIRALPVRPRSEDVPDLLVTALSATGRAEEAIGLLNEQLEREPNLPMVRNALARALTGRQQFKEAVAVLREGMKLAPDRRKLGNNLAILLVTCPDEEIRNPHEAIPLVERLCDQTRYQDPRYLNTLSLVYSTVRRIDEAVAVAEKALRIASESDRPEFSKLAPSIGLALETYKQAQRAGVNPMTGRGGATTKPADSKESPEDDSGGE
ncbi:MAG: sulfatase-like hydrolase/transferase [Planctomycetota bacterium]|nr:sulfatase-like hydrolase/transferase [Planctomycetota bacterium]